MVAVGETDVEPDAVGVTVPTLWSTVNDVALVVVHDRTEEAPGVIEVGFAVSVQVGAGRIVTVAPQVAEPPAPVTVPVYVVVVTGETDVEPDAVGVTVPMLLLMLKLVAFVVVHESEDELPLAIEVGVAVSVQVGAAGGAVTVTVAPQVAEPPAPVTVPV